MVPISQAYIKAIEAETEARTMDRWSLNAAGWNWAHPCACTAISLYLREMDEDSDPFPCLMTPGSHDQGQTVKAGEQGSPLVETHFAGYDRGWLLPLGPGEERCSGPRTYLPHACG